MGRAAAACEGVVPPLGSPFVRTFGLLGPKTATIGASHKLSNPRPVSVSLAGATHPPAALAHRTTGHTHLRPDRASALFGPTGSGSEGGS